MIGVVYSTTDRPGYLNNSLKSLQKQNYKIVVVDNGVRFKEQTKSIVDSYGAVYIDGQQTNSPAAQNKGFDYLKNDVSFIFKSDDDVDYCQGYIDKLLETILKDKNICAIGGPTYSKYRMEPAHFIDGVWKCNGKNVDEQLLLYKLSGEKKILVNSLHGGFLYRVTSAKHLLEKTTSIRGGVFGTYFSKYAFREESEFSFLLSQINNQKLVVDPKVVAFHHYANGGIRSLKNQKNMQQEDEKQMLSVCSTLGFPYTHNIFKGFYEDDTNNSK